jgi:hypothetical protein
MMAVKRILRYLRQTLNLGLWYSKCAHFILIGYSDSDYAGYKIDRVLQVLANSLEDLLFHGHPRNKTMLLYSPLKPNMFLLVVDVYNYFG